MYNICSWNTYVEYLCETLIEAHSFKSGQEDHACDYVHTLMEDFSAHGNHKENCSVGEDNPNMCKDVVIETELKYS